MLRRLSTVAILGLIVTSWHAKADFLPPNDLGKEDGLLRDTGITEEEFNKAIDAAEAYYQPIVASFSAKLKVDRLWSNSVVEAGASQLAGIWRVIMRGGLARRPEVTLDGFTLVICHEFGHHLAGYPYDSSNISTWAANEGQSDYFATLACGRQLWKDELATNASYRETVEAIPKALCDQAWEHEHEQNLCYRAIAGARSLGNLLATLNKTQANVSTLDQTQVQ